MKSKSRFEAGLSTAPHRLGLHGVKGRLVGSVKIMSAVHLALKARLLPDWVVLAKLWGDHGRHWGVSIREHERLENRPGRTQVGWMNKVEEQKNKENKESQIQWSRKLSGDYQSGARGSKEKMLLNT